MPVELTAIDWIIGVVLALTALWFVIASVWLVHLQNQARRSTVAAPAVRVHLAWLAVPLLAIPGGWQLQAGPAESLPTNLVENNPSQELPSALKAAESLDGKDKDNHPSPIVAVSHPVHPI